MGQGFHDRLRDRDSEHSCHSGQDNIHIQWGKLSIAIRNYASAKPLQRGRHSTK